jgi:hypothetical protein
VSLCPVLVFGLLAVASQTRNFANQLIRQNWGDIASVWGLGVSIYVLYIAKRAREAAEEVRSTERIRTVLEELQEAAQKCTQVGQFARDEKWDLVHLRAQEVMTSCRLVIARWGTDDVLKDSRNSLLQVATQMRSIVEATHEANVRGRAIQDAQIRSDEKLAMVVGTVHREQDKGNN